jgi:hypothetical protein
MSTPTIPKQTQVNWQLMCAIAGHHLFNQRLQAGISGPELTWIQGQLANCKATVTNLLNPPKTTPPTPSPSSAFVSIGNDFLQTPRYPPALSTWWMGILNSAQFPDDSGGNTFTFGVWLSDTNTLTNLGWSSTANTQTEYDLSFYTILFFASMETVFIGAISDLELYWNYTSSGDALNIFSGAMLAAYYQNQAGSLTAYQSNLPYICNAFDWNNLGLVPASKASAYLPGYQAFFSDLQGETDSDPLPLNCGKFTGAFVGEFLASSSPAGMSNFGANLDTSATMFNTLNAVYSAATLLTYKPGDITPLVTAMNSTATKTLFSNLKTSGGSGGPYDGLYKSYFWLSTLYSGAWPLALDFSQWTAVAHYPLPYDPQNGGPVLQQFTLDQYPFKVIANSTFPGQNYKPDPTNPSVWCDQSISPPICDPNNDINKNLVTAMTTVLNQSCGPPCSRNSCSWDDTDNTQHYNNFTIHADSYKCDGSSCGGGISNLGCDYEYQVYGDTVDKYPGVLFSISAAATNIGYSAMQNVMGNYFLNYSITMKKAA